MIKIKIQSNLPQVKVTYKQETLASIPEVVENLKNSEVC